MTTIPLTPIEAGDRATLASGVIEQDIWDLTPSIAERFLKLNIKNRPLSPQSIAKYRRDMESGRWVFAADPIRFDTTGSLIDGQHRLSALALCEDSTTIPFLVIRGLPNETQMVMDQGKKRTPGQQLAIKGVKNANAIAAGAKIYLTWKNGYLFRDNKVASMAISTPQIEEWVAANVDLVAHVNGHYGSLRANDAPPSVTTCAAFAFAQVSPDSEVQFFQALASGGMAKNHPINTLDKRLQRIRREGMKIPQRDYLAMFIQAWNATRDGRSMSQILRPKGGSWTEDNFPEPR